MYNYIHDWNQTHLDDIIFVDKLYSETAVPFNARRVCFFYSKRSKTTANQGSFHFISFNLKTKTAWYYASLSGISIDPSVGKLALARAQPVLRDAFSASNILERLPVGSQYAPQHYIFFTWYAEMVIKSIREEFCDPDIFSRMLGTSVSNYILTTYYMSLLH